MEVVDIVAFVALLIWPAVILVSIFTFRGAIVKVLSAADEAEIGPRGMKWRKNSEPKKINRTGDDVRIERTLHEDEIS